MDWWWDDSLFMVKCDEDELEGELKGEERLIWLSISLTRTRRRRSGRNHGNPKYISSPHPIMPGDQ